MLRLRLTGARIRWSSHMAAWVVWKQRMPPTSMTGWRQSSTSDLITRNSVWELGRQLRSSLPSSYTMISFQFRFFSISLPSLVVARSARLALPCCSRLRLNLSQQLTLMAPLMWLTLYAMKGRQSSSRKFLPPRPGEAGVGDGGGLLDHEAPLQRVALRVQRTGRQTHRGGGAGGLARAQEPSARRGLG